LSEEALLIAALAAGYLGYVAYEKNHADLSIGELEISANKGGSQHWIYWGVGVVCFIGFIYSLRRC
ncbi:MAG TPA: hypothetical protein DDY13_02105, partial [Cytophagales bacterium]|nr:hypothetical protein [Cytophagales bacterium]